MTDPAAGDSLSDLLVWQHGILSRAQAIERGISDGVLAAHLYAGRWQRVHTGIYATTTGPLTLAARRWAAVLACGPDAALSHHTAAAMHGLAADNGDPIHVTVPVERRLRRTPEIQVHRSRHLSHTRHPTLEPARTRVEPTALDLVHIAKSVDQALVIVAQACQRRLTTAARLRAEVSLRHSLRWRRQVLAALDDVGRGAHSLLELRYLRDVERRHGLPRSRRQRPVDRGRRREWTDVSYDEFATVVELDGKAGHDDVLSVWRDMRRDNAVVVAGEAPLRYGCGRNRAGVQGGRSGGGGAADARLDWSAPKVWSILRAITREILHGFDHRAPS